MASTSSREAALERRRALTNAGKKAESRYMSTPVRVRSAADARATRTEITVAASAADVSTVDAEASSPISRRARIRSVPSHSITPPGAKGRRSSAQPIANPSRQLVLSRREALSRRGKRADTSRDRTRSQLPPRKLVPSSSTSTATTPSPQGSSQASHPQLDRSSRRLSSLSNSTTRNGDRQYSSQKRNSLRNPSRALVLARREALSKRGKSASMPSTTTAASVARQANPDLSTKELAQKLRDLKNKVGSAGCSRNGGCRPTGPRRGKNRVPDLFGGAADAHWKVSSSSTSRGQMVTGTQANRSIKTTGNEASTCRSITGTEYLGAEIFRTFCQSEPIPTQPAKVRVSATSHGNQITGNEVGRSEKVTGDEPGTCKSVTGTEYLSANQSSNWCGGVTAPSPSKVGQSLTMEGRPVSGVMVGRSEKVTGDEPGAARNLTGTQYVSNQSDVGGRAPTKVNRLNTLRGTGITGTLVGRSEHVTGNEPGTCRNITGDEYIGRQQYEGFCGNKPAPEAAKVGFSVTNKRQVVSGTRTGRSEKVTGDEPGTCKAVTGTPYAGLDEAGTWCPTRQVDEIRQRTPVGLGTPGPRMSGIQPGIGGVMTGAEKGACEPISGTPYVGFDQMTEACGAANVDDVDFPQPLDGSQPWQRFSVQSPAQAAHTSRQSPEGVTGNRYEQGNRITGPFDLAGDRVTGTEQFRFDRNTSQRQLGPRPMAPLPGEEDSRPVSRVTGEGLSTGLHITGDDWDRGDRVTGTEGASARRRNPTRPGPMTAMPSLQSKRNVETANPVSKVTGSSGNTSQGSLITVSGGARG